MKILKTRNIYACGTVQVHRKELPQFVKEKSKLNRGEFKFASKNSVSAIKWMDNKPVNILSSYHGYDIKILLTLKEKINRVIQNLSLVPE